MIEELRERRMKDQDEEEKKVLEKIKAKMDRIKRTQQKLHGPTFKDTTNHFVGTYLTKSRHFIMMHIQFDNKAGLFAFSFINPLVVVLYFHKLIYITSRIRRLLVFYHILMYTYSYLSSHVLITIIIGKYEIILETLFLRVKKKIFY